MATAERWPPPESSADRRSEPCWTTGAKDGVGTAVAPRSRVWFTLVGSVLTEVYYPTIDQANTRDLRLVLTGPRRFFADEWHDGEAELEPLADGVPGYRVRSRFGGGRVEIVKTIVADDERAAVLIGLELTRTHVAAGDLRVHVLLSPHLGNQGAGNDGWLGRYKGVPMLIAQRGSRALALAYSGRMLGGSCTFVGKDDAWHELKAHGTLTRRLPHAQDGNLLLAAELDFTESSSQRRILALAFGDTPEDAGQQARAALEQDFDDVVRSYVHGWREFHDRCRAFPEDDADVEREYRTSLAVLRAHEDKAHAGGTIASLAIPWGEARGDHDGGGYHLIWARDLVEIAGALLSVGLSESARLALLYLMSTQEDSGHWPQNMWLDGKAYWRGVQLDEAGLPILLAEALDRHGALGAVDVWPMVRRAASYIVRNGPVTPEDRWEERAGYSPFTLAVEVAALVVAASFAERRGETQAARYLRETADYWNSQIEHWTYVTGTDLAERLEIGGYYVRLAPPRRRAPERASAGARATALKNHPVENGRPRYEAIVSPDALALVRFGLRRADDPRLVDTVRAIDEVLCSQTPTGPVWHRFTGDRYGEHKDGSPFDGDGIGRGWPLLAGERAHYEVARGNVDAARRLRRTMIDQASAGGLIPEQVWDAADIPARGLYQGRPTGSAMPLVWAHAEFLKLCRSIEEERVFDTPPLVRDRYAHDGTRPKIVVWRANEGRHRVRPGMVLRVERRAPFTISWCVAGAERRGAIDSVDSGVGIAFADVPTEDLEAGAEIRFAIRPASGDQRWSREHVVRVTAEGA